MAWIVVLNGVPRSGKSSIAEAISAAQQGEWVVSGVDAAMASTDRAWWPGVGLRPGNDHPHVRAALPELFDSMWATVLAHHDRDDSVVVDVGIYDPAMLRLALAALAGRPVLWVEVTCSLDEVVRRRRRSSGYVVADHSSDDGEPVRRWHDAVYGLDHAYDLRVDTTARSASDIADEILGATAPR